MDKPKSTATRATVSGGGGRDKPDKRKDKKDKGGGGGGKSGGSNKRNKRNKKDAALPMTRVVIRRLPPTMTEAVFCEQISTDGKMPNHDEFYFVGPDWTLGHNASCRAYINFTNPEDIFRFTDSYDGYTFVDSKGMEHQAVVEYAPFQKLPKTRSRKKDPKCNTIETDTHFLAFKEALEAEEQEALHGRGTQEFSFKIEHEEKTTTTPLLEFIAQRKQEKRDEKRRKQEEKRRMRDEERHMRKTQIARSIPDAICEEVVSEIMERAVLPRLNPAQNASKPMGTFSGKGGGGGAAGGADGGKFKDDKDKKSKNKKEKERNRDKKGEDTKAPPESGKPDGGDKNAGSRKQDRDKGGKKGKEKQGKDEPRFREQNQQQQQQQKGERNESKLKKDKPPAEGHPSGGNSEPHPSTSKAANPSTGASSNDGTTTKKEVKKYSERRKETRARAETRLAEQDTRNEPDSNAKDTGPPATSKPVEVKKSILTANVPPFIPKEKTTILLAGHASTATNIPVEHLLTEKMAKVTIEKRPQTGSQTDNGKKSPSPDGAAPGPKTKLSEKQRELREARKIRNKDRPSIEIYQPRKRIVSGGGTGKSEDDRGRSDSDRPSDNVSASASAGAAVENDAKERRHKLTKKASDRPQRERKNGRKNSIEVDSGGKETVAGGSVQQG
ncbi:regulator of nonsense transcripts 3B-like [Anopheles stephensi]|uniref:regulator of nonsense transcripts 3B-like n=1 Tax=Anopheles stephensi TaxID=30069 RepID=UPI001658C3F0|nr:regulator of nonsense transcripts 3B-like [Anopheles stephensi]